MLDMMFRKLSLLEMMNETENVGLFSSILQLLLYTKCARYPLTYLERDNCSLLYFSFISISVQIIIK